jgi:hypothetical protein
MPTVKKQSVHPPVQNNASSQTSSETPAQPSPPITENENSNSSETPSDTTNLPSYLPPGVQLTPTSPPSETEENPSSEKSSSASKPQKTSQKKSPPQPSVEPKKHPALGCGGVEYLNYAAATFSEEKFSEYYLKRAAHLLVVHADNPDAAPGLERLEKLLNSFN